MFYEKVSIILPPLCTSPSGTPHSFHNDSVDFCFSDPELSADLKPSQVCNIPSQCFHFSSSKKDRWGGSGVDAQQMEPHCHLVLKSVIDLERLAVCSFCLVIAERKWFGKNNPIWTNSSFVSGGEGVDNYNCCNDHSLLMNLVNSGETAVIPPYWFCGRGLRFCFCFLITIVFRRPEYVHQRKTLIVKLRTFASVTITVVRRSRTRWPLTVERKHIGGWKLSGSTSTTWVSARAVTCSYTWLDRSGKIEFWPPPFMCICSVDIITKVNAIIFRPMETVLRWPDENWIAVTTETGSCCIKTRLTLSWNG